jgi:hypothetical protein
MTPAFAVGDAVTLADFCPGCMRRLEGLTGIVIGPAVQPHVIAAGEHPGPYYLVLVDNHGHPGFLPGNWTYAEQELSPIR